MANRAECPVCESYSSNVYADIHFNFCACRNCKCPHEILLKWQDLLEEVESLKKQMTDKELLKQIQDVEKDNAKLKTKLARLESLLGYDGSVVKPILDAIKILFNQEIEDETY